MNPDGSGRVNLCSEVLWNGEADNPVKLRGRASWAPDDRRLLVMAYGVYACVAVDPIDGDLLIAHSLNNRIFAFRKTHLGSWEDAEAEAVGDGSGTRAIFHEDGTPYVSCIRAGRAYVTYHDGAAWQSERIADSARPRTDIGRDPAGGWGVIYGCQDCGVGLGRQE